MTPTPPNNTTPDQQQQPPPAQSPPPPSDTTFVDTLVAGPHGNVIDRLVAAGLTQEDAERMVENVNRLIGTGVPRDMAIRAVGSHPGRVEQGIGVALTSLIQGLGIPLADVARVNNQTHPEIWPGLWPGIDESTPATVAPDLPAPVSSALGLGGSLGGTVAKFALLGKAVSAIPGLAPVAGRFISALLDRIPVPGAAALAQAIRTGGPAISYLPGEAVPAATATRTVAGAAAGAGKAARVLSDTERRRLLLQEIEKAVAAANERAATSTPRP